MPQAISKLTTNVLYVDTKVQNVKQVSSKWNLTSHGALGDRSHLFVSE